QHFVLRAHASFKTNATPLRIQNQIARFLELRRVNGIKAVLFVFESGADQVAHGVNQREASRVLFLVEKQSPGLLDRFVLRLAQVNADRPPLVSHGVSIVAVVRRAGEFLVEVFEIWNVPVPQRREQFQLDHRRHDVVGRNHDIVERNAPALDFGEHALGVLVNVDRDLAVELFLELLHDLRVDVFAPDEEVELVRFGAGEMGEAEAKHEKPKPVGGGEGFHHADQHGSSWQRPGSYATLK